MILLRSIVARRHAFNPTRAFRQFYHYNLTEENDAPLHTPGLPGSRERNQRMPEMIRPAATKEDKAIFNHLLQKISAVDSYFCCGGTLELVDRPFTLYYKSHEKNNWINFHNLSEQSATERQSAIEKLLQACVPAPHGRGDETVLDESYRLARELRQDEFAFSVDLLSEVGTGILSSIRALTAGRSALSKAQASQVEVEDEEEPEVDIEPNPEKSVPNLTITPRMYKLNAYPKNGFFKSHRDTPKGGDHIGTLMIALPVAHQGGVLRVNHDGKEVLFDWHEQCSKGVEVSSREGKVKMLFPWAFIFSDVEHEVLPVESGMRVSIAYDIFASHAEVMDIGPGPVASNIMDGTTIPLYEEFVAALRNPSFLTKGAEVAIALSHSYPMAREAMELNSEQFASELKGVDAIVYRAMKAAGFDVSLRAVMTQEAWDYSADGIPRDGYDPALDDEITILLTSSTFTYTDDKDLMVDDGAVDYNDEDSVVKKTFNARASPQLMWVKKPKDTLVNAGSYLAYSNDYSLDFFYAAAAFILKVPPFGEGSRVF